MILKPLVGETTLAANKPERVGKMGKGLPVAKKQEKADILRGARRTKKAVLMII